MKSESSELLLAELTDPSRMSTYLQESLKNCVDFTRQSCNRRPLERSC